MPCSPTTTGKAGHVGCFAEDVDAEFTALTARALVDAKPQEILTNTDDRGGAAVNLVHAVLYPIVPAHAIGVAGGASVTPAAPPPGVAHPLPPSSDRPEFPEEFRPEFLEPALVLGQLIALPVGIYSAIRQDTPAD